MLKEIALEEAQAVSFRLFKIFDGICKKYNLRYFLSGGTLLGAIRHRGFIPWDDDMDVMMPRPDYEKLLALELKLPSDIELVSCESNRDYFIPFAKMCDMKTKLSFPHHVKEKSLGLFIDIFPIDALPDSKIRQKIYFFKMKSYDTLRNSALRKTFINDEKFIGIKKYLVMPFAKIKGPNYYANKMNRYAIKWTFGSTKHAGVTMITHYGERELMDYDVFADKSVVYFNEYQCFAPVGWDTYLSNLYGDYMKLPPVEKRNTDHSNFIIEIRE